MWFPCSPKASVSRSRYSSLDMSMRSGSFFLSSSSREATPSADTLPTRSLSRFSATTGMPWALAYCNMSR